MKLHLAKHEPGRMGGGWTFLDNLAKALSDNISNYEESDIYFISGASMCSREDVLKAKDDGKKVVLRIDNIPRPSRNRGTSMTRMKDFAEWSDLVVYQSTFSKNLLDKFLKPNKSITILNGCDLDMFFESSANVYDEKFLFVRSSSDETKNWEMARSHFQLMAEPKSLTIVGKALDPKIHEYNFDMFMGERVGYMGEVHNRESMAAIYRSHHVLLYSYFNDACSNTLIEALCCGMSIADCYGMLNTGGASEIMNFYKNMGRSFFGLERMGKQYKEALCGF